METQLLKNPDILPSTDVLKNALGNNVYEIFESYINTVTGADYGLTYEWNYYNDGKSWFCKIIHKKKTVHWLSAWDGCFKIAFYFTEKHLERIAALDISEKIKEDFCKTKPAGRLLPMLFTINQKEQLDDLLKVVTFKKSLK
jgi:hypothetical protein